MRKILISLVCAMPLFIMGFELFKSEDVKIPKEEAIVNSLIGRIAESLKKKYKIKPVGTSVSMPRCIVKKLGIHFQIHGPLTRNEIRKILIEISKDFVGFVNEDLEIKPLLQSFPFTSKNVDIALFIIDEKGRDIWAPHISIAGIKNGMLDYLIINDNDNDFPNIQKFIETYDEALELF